MWGCVRLGLLLALVGLVLVSSAETGASPGLTERVSLSSAGAEGTSDSGAWGRPAVNASVRYVAFESFSTNLVSGDTQLCGSPPLTYNCPDIFVRDRDVGTTTRVSVNSGGGQANGSSFQPAISSDGRYVAFDSDAANLVSGDTNDFCQTDPDPELDNCSDVFVRDRQTGATTRMSVNSAGTEGNGASFQPAISSDGRYVAFESDATNLVDGDTDACGQPPNTYNCPDIFVRDRQTSTTTRVSVDSGGGQANGDSFQPAISGDGRYVAFYSEATNLVSPDGNGCGDIFVHDRQAGTTTRVSVKTGGNEAHGSSYGPAISGDGRYVAFYSAATDLVDGDTNGYMDVFVHDRDTGGTERASVDSGGSQASGGASSDVAISADGRFVAFQSTATNLVLIDTNGAGDIFVRDRQMGATTRVSVHSAGGEGNGNSSAPAISTDGRFVAFYSRASNLVPLDTNGRQDVFLRYSSEAVGGMAELPDVAIHRSRPEVDYALLAALAVVGAVVALTAGAWYAGRRRAR